MPGNKCLEYSTSSYCSNVKDELQENILEDEVTQNEEDPTTFRELEDALKL